MGEETLVLRRVEGSLTPGPSPHGEGSRMWLLGFVGAVGEPLAGFFEVFVEEVHDEVGGRRRRSSGRCCGGG